jgi:hypothetical protein
MPFRLIQYAIEKEKYDILCRLVSVSDDIIIFTACQAHTLPPQSQSTLARHLLLQSELSVQQVLSKLEHFRPLLNSMESNLAVEFLDKIKKTYRVKAQGIELSELNRFLELGRLVV